MNKYNQFHTVLVKYISAAFMDYLSVKNNVVPQEPSKSKDILYWSLHVLYSNSTDKFTFCRISFANSARQKDTKYQTASASAHYPSTRHIYSFHYGYYLKTYFVTQSCTKNSTGD